MRTTALKITSRCNPTPYAEHLQDSFQCLHIWAGWCSKSPSKVCNVGEGLCNVMYWGTGKLQLQSLHESSLTARYFWKSHHLWLAVICCAGVTNCQWPCWLLEQLRNLLKGRSWDPAFLCTEQCIVWPGLIWHVSPSMRSNWAGILESNQCKVRIRPSYSCLQSHFWERASLIVLPQCRSGKGRIQGVPGACQSLQLFSAQFSYAITLLRRFCKSITIPIRL